MPIFKDVIDDVDILLPVYGIMLKHISITYSVAEFVEFVLNFNLFLILFHVRVKVNVGHGGLEVVLMFAHFFDESFGIISCQGEH